MNSAVKVWVSRFAQKQIERLPRHIWQQFDVWKLILEQRGLQQMRAIPGYRDEALAGNRKGQRSSRLNRSYRVIYQELRDGELLIIAVLEVNKHEY